MAERTLGGAAESSGNSRQVAGRDASSIITREMQNEWLDRVRVVLRGGDVRTRVLFHVDLR